MSEDSITGPRPIAAGARCSLLRELTVPRSIIVTIGYFVDLDDGRRLAPGPFGTSELSFPTGSSRAELDRDLRESLFEDVPPGPRPRDWLSRLVERAFGVRWEEEDGPRWIELAGVLREQGAEVTRDELAELPFVTEVEPEVLPHLGADHSTHQSDR